MTIDVVYKLTDAKAIMANIHFPSFLQGDHGNFRIMQRLAVTSPEHTVLRERNLNCHNTPLSILVKHNTKSRYEKYCSVCVPGGDYQGNNWPRTKQTIL